MGITFENREGAASVNPGRWSGCGGCYFESKFIARGRRGVDDAMWRGVIDCLLCGMLIAASATAGSRVAYPQSVVVDAPRVVRA